MVSISSLKVNHYLMNKYSVSYVKSFKGYFSISKKKNNSTESMFLIFNIALQVLLLLQKMS